MNFFIATLFFFFILCNASAQQTIVTDSLCNTPVQIVILKAEHAEKNFYFISVHEDEATGIEAAKEFVQDSNGIFLHCHIHFHLLNSFL